MALRHARARLRPLPTVAARLPPKTAAPWYGMPEHKAWRAEVIARAGGVCQGPGCGRREQRMFADHIVEIRDGGGLTDPANGQCLCGSCHTAKTAAARAARMGAR
ncbi:HNH endonuclease [Roseiarcus fermentans]|uniref:HNH endonuclease n=1 Tax=Roseiarcus fermentans TaxID=1473586 RepID=A0A366EN68_9HYPH|nr:HNH endonuclease [Roseiarcus fermentans]